MNVTSVNDIGAAPFGGWYSTSKAALMSLTYVLRAELTGTGIHVTVVAPGLFRTPMAEKQREQQAPPGSRYERAFEGIRKGGAAQLAMAADPADAASVIEELIRSYTPPARLVIGATGVAMEERVRNASAEEYAALLRNAVVKLAGATEGNGDAAT